MVKIYPPKGICHWIFSARLKCYVPGLIDSESRDLDSLLPPVLSESLNIPNVHDLIKEGPLRKEYLKSNLATDRFHEVKYWHYIKWDKSNFCTVIK